MRSRAARIGSTDFASSVGTWSIGVCATSAAIFSISSRGRHGDIAASLGGTMVAPTLGATRKIQHVFRVLMQTPSASAP